ncbi:2012_t:CDS:2, partial [Funneliformis geosporum]
VGTEIKKEERLGVIISTDGLNNKHGKALIDQVKTVDKKRLIKKLGQSIEKLTTKEEIVKFMKEAKEEFDTKITWLHFDLEMFLFGEKAESNKEYNLISRKIKILDNLKENEPAKFKELRKIFNFLEENCSLSLKKY